MYSRIAIIFATIAAATVSQAQYRVVDIGSLGGNSSGCFRLNDMGQVAGSSKLANGQLHGVIWDNGTLRDISIPNRVSEAWSINNSGVVVGWSCTTSQNYERRPFIWSGAMTIIPAHLGTKCSSINNAGQAVGDYVDSYGETFGYAGGVVTPFTVPGSTVATAFRINDNGIIIGTASIPTGQGTFSKAYRGSAGSLQTLNDYTTSHAYDINNAGLVVGDIDPTGNGHSLPLLWGANSSQVITTLPQGWTDATFFAVNENGDCVGGALAGAGQIAFLYRNGVFTDLNDFVTPGTGFVIQGATGINDSGVISGWGWDATFHDHGFVLIPTSSYWGQGVPLQFAVTGYSLAAGNAISGTVDSLTNFDDDRLVLRPGLVFSMATDPMQVILSGSSSIASPSSVSFVIESSLVGPSGRRTVFLRNFEMSKWDQIDQTATTQQDYYAQFDVGPATASQYVQSGTGLMQAKVTWRATSVTLQYPWVGRIDAAFWRCQN